MGAKDRKPHRLTKSRLMAMLQCPKRLWLETHLPQAADASPARQQAFAAGNEAGELARKLAGKGVLIGSPKDPLAALAETKAQLRVGAGRLYEPAFRHRDVLVRADILERGRGGYRLREVKSATSVKAHYLQDTAIQAWVLEGAGLDLSRVSLQHLDGKFVYPGHEDYGGLFVEERVNAAIAPLLKQVPKWVAAAQATLAGPEPAIHTGKHCRQPYSCAFQSYCSAQEPASEYPLSILPHAEKLVTQLTAAGYVDLRDVPENRLKNEKHLRIWRVTRAGRAELRPRARQEMRALPYPRYYFDFETVGFAVPRWPGTRPYQQVPFQWSCHVERAPGKLAHRAHLDTTGESPLAGVAESMLDALGDKGPILAHNAGFERARIAELSRHLPKRAAALRRVAARLVDTLTLCRDYYYHPEMKGSWSLKAILPTIAPELDYASVGEVQDGGSAAAAYQEIIAPDTPARRKAELRAALERYCERDTLALVRVARFLQAGR